MRVSPFGSQLDAHDGGLFRGAARGRAAEAARTRKPREGASFDSTAFHDRTRRRLLAGTMRPERVSPCLASRRIRGTLASFSTIAKDPQEDSTPLRDLHPFARPFLGPRVDESRVQLLARPRARRNGTRDRDACDRRQPRMERNEIPTFFRSIIDESRLPLLEGRAMVTRASRRV